MCALGETASEARKVVTSLLLVRIGLGIVGLAVLAILYATK